MCKSFLVFVEDPGAANMIIELPYHFREKNFEYDILACNYASEILTSKNISHTNIKNKSQLINFLKNKNYDRFLIGTSENKESLGLEIINIGKQRQIKTIALVDMLVNASERFKGKSQNPLKFIPDYLIVTDSLTKITYNNLGIESERIFICDHPQQERIKNLKKTFEIKFPNFKNKSSRWLFISENIDLMDPSQSYISENYLLNGRGSSKWRTAIVIEEIIDLLKKVSPTSKLEVRLHPKNTIDQFDEFADEIIFDRVIDPLESVWKADFILGMSSNLLVEAIYLGKKVLSILPRYEEKKWMSELEEGVIETVFTREDLFKKLQIFNCTDNKLYENRKLKIANASLIKLISSI